MSEWPWIFYYASTRCNRRWKEGTLKYIIAEHDIIQKLKPPEIIMEGRLLLYIFKGNL